MSIWQWSLWSSVMLRSVDWLSPIRNPAWQPGRLARQQNALSRPNWIGGFLLFQAQSTHFKWCYLTGKKREQNNRKCSIEYLKNTTTTTNCLETFATATFFQTAIKWECKCSLSSHWNAQLPAVVLSTVWTWLAVSRLRQHCALHMKQDMGLYPLGEFTSSGPPPPPPPNLPPETSGPFSWRPDIPSSSGGFSGLGVVGSKRGSVRSCTLENGRYWNAMP